MPKFDRRLLFAAPFLALVVLVPPERLTAQNQRPLTTAGEKGMEAFAPEMVIVPDGHFLMGSAEDDSRAYGDERPQRQVSIRAFAVGKYEVTFDEWDACVAGGGCNGYLPRDEWGRGRQPVINVSWYEAQAYVAWLSQVTGKRYRLPSEAEWEYAARAGTTTAYAFGSTITEAQANFTSFTNSSGSGSARLVGSYPANAFGLHDMHGNVGEWTEDCKSDSYEGAPADGSARTSGDCRIRVGRGGAWRSDPRDVRSAVRERLTTDDRYDSLGFRVARTLD